MGGLADTLFTLMLGWVRSAVDAIRTAISSGGEAGMLNFLGRNWLWLVGLMVAVGLFFDAFMYMVRWRPYRVWGTRMRKLARLFGIGKAREDEEALPPEGGDTVIYQQEEMPAQEYEADIPMEAEDAYAQDNIDFMPEEEDEFSRDAMIAQYDERAAQVTDEELGEYPGMYYTQDLAEDDIEEPTRIFAPTQEAEDMDDIDDIDDADDADFDADDWTREIEAVREDEGIPDPLAAYDDPQVLSRFMRPKEERLQAIHVEQPAFDEAVVYGEEAAEEEAYEAPYDEAVAYGEEAAEQEAYEAPYDDEAAEMPEEVADVPQDTVLDAPQPRQGDGASRRRRRRAGAAPPPVNSEEFTAPPMRTIHRTSPFDSLPERQEWPGWDVEREDVTPPRAKRKSTGDKKKKEKDGEKRGLFATLFDPQGEKAAVLPPRVDYKDVFGDATAPEGWADDEDAPPE